MARIFIAIRFDEAFKKTLVGLQNALRAKGVSGNFCPYGNLHMTLAFIGEKYDLPKICKAVDEVEFEPFVMSLGRLGTFPTRSGVVWCGVRKDGQVAAWASQLRQRLSAYGIPFSAMPFLPHVSLLVQHPSHIVTEIDVPEASIKVERISVMKSERINGKLVYSEI